MKKSFLKKTIFFKFKIIINLSLILAILSFGILKSPFTVNAVGASLAYIGPTSYDASLMTFTNTFSVALQDTIPKEMIFNDDGTKMFVIGGQNDSIYEYSLSTPYSISTSTFVQSQSIATHETGPRGLSFNNDGTKIYVIGSTGDDIDTYSLTTPYDLTAISFISTFSVAAQDTSPQDLTFNNDGTKLYIAGDSGNDINEYALTTPYDVSSATFTTVFSVSAQDTHPHGIDFNYNGTKLVVAGSSSDSVYLYTLTTPFDLTTASFQSQISVSAQETAPSGVVFNNNGSKLYVVGDTGNDINEYSIPYGNFTEAIANDGSIDNTSPIAIKLTNDTFQDIDADNILDVGTEVTIGNIPAGLTPVVTLSANDTVATLTLTGNAIAHNNINDVTDITFVFDNTAFTGGDATVVARSGSAGAYSTNIGINFENKGSIAYTGLGFHEIIANNGAVTGSIIATVTGETFVDANTNGVLDIGTEVTLGNVPAGLTPVVTLSNLDKVATLVLTGNALAHNDTNNVTDITFVFDNTTFAGGDASIITNSGSLGAYSTNKGVHFLNPPILNYIGPSAYDTTTPIFNASFSIVAQDTAPQEMIFNDDGTRMFVAGEQSPNIYEYALTTPYSISTGSFIGSTSIAAEETRPKGLTFNNDGMKLYVIGSSGDNVYEYSLSAPYDISTPILITKFSVATQDIRPRDIIFNNDGTKFYMVGDEGNDINEYLMSVPYDISSATFNTVFSVNAQETDPQGMALSHDGTQFVIVGGTGDIIVTYSLSTPFDLSTASFQHQFSVADKEIHPRGVVFNNDGTKIYVTGTQYGSITEYSINPGNFTEASINNGSIDNTSPLIIRLKNDTFQDTDADNILDVGTEVTIGNIPAGLTPVMTLSDNDTIATLTFTGNAIAHDNTDSITNLTFTFNNTAFLNGDSSVVTRSGSTIAYNSNIGIDFTANPTKSGSNKVTNISTSLVKIISPDINQTLFSGTLNTISFDLLGKGIVTTNISYSQKNGTVKNLIKSNIDADYKVYGWYTPSTVKGETKIIVEGYDNAGILVHADSVDVNITPPSNPNTNIPVEPTPKPIPDPIIPKDEPIVVVNTDQEGRTVAKNTNEMGISPITGKLEEISVVESGWYVRSFNYDTVYYVDDNFERHPLWNPQIYFTFDKSWSDVVWVTDATLPTMKLSTVILPRKDRVLLKNPSSPKVYYIDEDKHMKEPVIRWVPSEQAASKIFGPDWREYIIDVDQIVLNQYTIGSDMKELASPISTKTGKWITRKELSGKTAVQKIN